MSPSQLYFKPESLDLAYEHTSHKKGIWDFPMTEIMKYENLLEGNLHNLFTLLMSLCDSDTKTQVKESLIMAQMGVMHAWIQTEIIPTDLCQMALIVPLPRQRVLLDLVFVFVQLLLRMMDKVDARHVWILLETRQMVVFQTVPIVCPPRSNLLLARGSAPALIHLIMMSKVDAKHAGT